MRISIITMILGLLVGATSMAADTESQSQMKQTAPEKATQEKMKHEKTQKHKHHRAHQQHQGHQTHKQTK